MREGQRRGFAVGYERSANDPYREIAQEDDNSQSEEAPKAKSEEDTTESRPQSE